MIKLLVVDDHTIIRQGIVGLLRTEEGFEVVAEAGTGEAAVRLALDLQPDVIVLDMSLPDMDGIAVAQRLRGNGGGSEIVFLTMHNDPGLRDAAARTGARGYLLKDDAMDDLLYAIRAVLRKERYLSGSLGSKGAETSTSTPEGPLTRREKEVVALIGEGLTSREIADRLCISVRTVETHRGRIMEKMGFRNVADVIRYAIKSGLSQ